MASFGTLLPIVLQWEGTKYTDDPDDPGGPTKYGVTQKTLSDFLGKQATKNDVKNLTVDSVIPIYRKKYWDLIQGDKLSDGVGLIMLDGAINHGVKGIVMMVQKIIGTNADGKLGDDTLNKINGFSSQFDLVMQISNYRRTYYQGLDGFQKYGKGWINRLNDITNKSLAYENKYVVKKPEIEIKEEPVVKPIPESSDKISNQTLQILLKDLQLYNGPIDGLIGKNSKDAITNLLTQKVNAAASGWSDDRKLVAIAQLLVSMKGIDAGQIDGYYGPQTRQAFKEFNHILDTGQEMPKWRDELKSPVVKPAPSNSGNNWPLQKDVEKFYGKVGENQTSLILPYKMKIAWDTKTTITKFSCHEKVHDSLLKIFQKTLDHYGEEKISELRLDYFGGCLNVRKMRGGSAWSMHSWGIAVDLDPERNQLEWHKNKAVFAKPDYNEFWKIVESEGWVSLGRTSDYDWMHFQAARI